MDKKVEKAVEILKSGGIVLLPTDTVFGICCRIDNNKALERLFAIKKRENSQAVPILVSSTDMVKEYAQPFNEKIEKLMEQYWPGGLTIVIKAKKEKVLPLVRGDGDTVGVRIPDSVSLFQIIEEVGVPITGTSANFHGLPSVKNWKDLDPRLVQLVDYVLEEDSLGGTASTVVDCSEENWKILRQGAVTIKL
ncbi:MAG TPA: L-threonylcarbamoyladenylate synthase [Candidatus Eisenbacteria bacterium]|nr:L-threonylcarbamoyladenylate synthase [Candidatus Eisenbacteria bacterium]